MRLYTQDRGGPSLNSMTYIYEAGGRSGRSTRLLPVGARSPKAPHVGQNLKRDGTGTHRRDRVHRSTAIVTIPNIANIDGNHGVIAATPRYCQQQGISVSEIPSGELHSLHDQEAGIAIVHHK